MKRLLGTIAFINGLRIFTIDNNKWFGSNSTHVQKDKYQRRFGNTFQWKCAPHRNHSTELLRKPIYWFLIMSGTFQSEPIIKSIFTK